MSGLTDFISAIIKPARSIGGIAAQVTIEEQGQDDLAITQHPIEFGAAITDHAFKQPSLVTIHCAWSNSGVGALLNIAQSALAAFTGSAGGGFNYTHKIYNDLLALQASRTLITVVTGKRSYSNMLIRTIIQHTDAKTEMSLAVTLICQQVIVVNTVATTLPPEANMQQPQNTASVSKMGTQSLNPPLPAGAIAF